jgi:hypothetical protein
VAETSLGSSMTNEVLSISNVSHHVQHWLLYLGASNHMCLHRHGFFSYQSIDDIVVYTRNDISYKIVGIGSVQIKMYDGYVKTLTDVRHVLELRKNLISLGVLDIGGYKCIVQGGVMKVYKGILLVMKDKMIDNIYLLEGRTKSDHATTVSQNASDSTRLWHQHLGHMREKGLKVPTDRKLIPSLKSLNLDFYKHCIYEKQSRQKFKTRRHANKGILDYIHSDVWGLSPTIS